MKVSLQEARLIGQYLRAQHDYIVGQIHIDNDGAVTAIADPMPNTNQRGRIFCGWDTELLKEAQL